MRYIIGNYRTSSYFTSCAGSGWNSYKMWDIVRYIHIATNQIVILKQIFAVINAEQNSARHIQTCTSANANNTISLMIIVSIGSGIYIALYRILADFAEHFGGKSF